MFDGAYRAHILEHKLKSDSIDLSILRMGKYSQRAACELINN